MYHISKHEAQQLLCIRHVRKTHFAIRRRQFQLSHILGHFTSFSLKFSFQRIPILAWAWIISQYLDDIYHRKEVLFFLLIPYVTDIFPSNNLISLCSMDVFVLQRKGTTKNANTQEKRTLLSKMIDVLSICSSFSHHNRNLFIIVYAESYCNRCNRFLKYCERSGVFTA